MKLAGFCRRALLALVIATGPAGLAQAEIKLRLGSGQTEDSLLYQRTYKVWLDMVNEAGAGVVSITNFPPPFADAPNVWDRVTQGMADIGVVGLNATGLPLRKTFVTTLPSAEISAVLPASVALQQVYEQGLLDPELDEVKILAMFAVIPNKFYTRDPITAQSDVDGLRVRVGDANIVRLATALGAAPASIPFSEAYQAISKGVVDTAISNEISMYTYKWGELLHSGVDGYTFGMAPFVIAMNREKYDSLPPEAKKIIDDHSGMMLAELLGKGVAEVEDTFTERLVSSGQLVMYPLPEDMRPTWDAAMQRIRDEWIADIDGGGPLYEAFLNAYRAGGN